MISWSAPLYLADRRVAIVGAVEIGYVVPPCSLHPYWRWFLMFKRGRDSDGAAIDEHSAKLAVAHHWRRFLVDAQLVWAARPEVRP